MTAPRPLGRGEIGLLTALAVASLCVQMQLASHFTDDAYITLRYVQRLLAGQGLSFNPGERVEGFSNPLWLLLIAAVGGSTGLDLVFTAKLLGFGASIATLFAVRRIARSMGVTSLFSVTLVMIATTPGVQVFAGLGMEVPLLMALLTWGLAFSLEAEPHAPRATLAASTCMALVAVTRPEGALYTLLWGLALALVWLRGNHTAGPKRAWLLVCAGVIAVLPWASYQAFRVAYFASWLPNTALAKPAGMWRFKSLRDDVAGYLGVGACLLALGLLRRAKPAANVRKLVLFGAASLVSNCVFSIYSGPDWMEFGRFQLPAWPIALIVCGLPLAARLEAQPPHSPRVVLALCALALAHGLWGLGCALPYAYNRGLAPMLMRGTDQVAVGQWVAHRFPMRRTIAIGRLGAVGYFAPQHVLWDFFGLTDTEQARVVRERWPDARVTGPEPDGVIMRRNPDLVLVHHGPVPPNTTAYTDHERAALASYRCLEQFPQGHWGTLDVWIKPALLGTLRPACRAE